MTRTLPHEMTLTLRLARLMLALMVLCLLLIGAAKLVGRLARIGQVLVYVVTQEQVTTLTRQMETDLWMVDLDRGVSVPLTNTPEIAEANPSWSPDGLQVVFDANDPERQNWDLYTLNILDGSVRRLTFDDAPDTDPAWSPDGRMIAFVSDRDGTFNSEIHLIAVDAPDDSETTRLTDERTVPHFTPAWSPDGERVLYTSNDPNNNGMDIYAVDVDTQAVEHITLGAQRFALNPVWSPDQRWIAYSIYLNSVVYIMSPLSGRSIATIENVYAEGLVWLSNTELLYNYTGPQGFQLHVYDLTIEDSRVLIEGNYEQMALMP